MVTRMGKDTNLHSLVSVKQYEVIIRVVPALMCSPFSRMHSQLTGVITLL